MKFRFSLRALLIATGLIALVLGWVCYQLEWIRQRHEFLSRYGIPMLFSGIYGTLLEPPWQLRLFGEQTQNPIAVVKDHSEEAKRLFPEAQIYEYDRNGHLIKNFDPLGDQFK